MLKKKMVRSRDSVPAMPDQINYLSASACMAWVGEILQTYDLDCGWALAEDGDQLMDCFQIWVTTKEPYAEIAHYTRGKCCKDILGIEIVYCLKRRKDSKWATLTQHIAGECPALHYGELEDDE